MRRAGRKYDVVCIMENGGHIVRRNFVVGDILFEKSVLEGLRSSLMI